MIFSTVFVVLVVVLSLIVGFGLGECKLGRRSKDMDQCDLSSIGKSGRNRR